MSRPTPPAEDRPAEPPVAASPARPAGMPVPPDMIRVAIVDDHPIARWGARQVLVESGRVQVVSCVESVGELAAALTALDWTERPDVVLLDLYLGDDQPCLPAVAELSGGLCVLVMSASGRRADVLGAVRSGARGYITKQATPAMLVAAVETVAAGGFALSAQLADLLHSELTQEPAASGGTPHTSALPRLSAREEEALSLIARGFTHAQTATRMGVTKATVNTYVERIRGKLQVGNKAELTRVAMQRTPPTGP